MFLLMNTQWWGRTGGKGKSSFCFNKKKKSETKCGFQLTVLHNRYTRIILFKTKCIFTLSRAREIFKLTEEMNEVTFYNVSLSDTFLTPRFCEEK